MSNRFAINKLTVLIDTIENKTGRWAKVVNDPFKDTMLEQLRRAREAIGTDYVDINDVEWNDDPL